MYVYVGGNEHFWAKQISMIKLFHLFYRWYNLRENVCRDVFAYMVADTIC